MRGVVTLALMVGRALFALTACGIASAFVVLGLVLNAASRAVDRDRASSRTTPSTDHRSTSHEA